MSKHAKYSAYIIVYFVISTHVNNVQDYFMDHDIEHDEQDQTVMFVELNHSIHTLV